MFDGGFVRQRAGSLRQVGGCFCSVEGWMWGYEWQAVRLGDFLEALPVVARVVAKLIS